MAAVATPVKAVDLRTTRAKAVRLGDSLIANKDGLVSLQYNHKPTVEQNSTASLRRGSGNNTSSLILQDEGQEYSYDGVEDSVGDTLVLLSDDKGDGWLLEKLGSAWLYNLTKAPWEADKDKLAKDYTQLVPSEQLESVNTDDDDSTELGEPEADNPFDWRHYFTPASPKSVQPARSNAGRASPQPAKATSRQSTPLARPARRPAPSPMLSNQRKPRQSNGAAEPLHKRHKSNDLTLPKVKVSSHPTLTPATRPKQKHAVVEDINLDASTPTLEKGGMDLSLDDVLPNKWKKGSAMSKAMSGTLGVSDGPISLRSAASSPASRVGSPAAGGFANNDGDLVMDVDPPSAATPPPRSLAASSRDDVIVEDDDDDVDEDLVLPSPVKDRTSTTTARCRSSGVQRTTTAEADADDDDELEAGLMEAMMADDDDVPSAPVVADEEEESEEE